MSRFLLSLVVLLLAAIFAFGDCTRRAVKSQRVVVVQRVVVAHDYNHYYSLDPYYQQQALAAQIVRQLRTELRQAPPAPPTQPAPKNEELPPPKGELVAGKYQNDKLLAVVNNSCAKCHGANSKQTSFVTADGKALADVPAGKVWEAFGLVNSGEMPKASDNLNDEAVKLFYDWAKNARKS